MSERTARPPHATRHTRCLSAENTETTTWTRTTAAAATTTTARGTLCARSVHDYDGGDETAGVGWSAAAAGLTFLPTRWWRCPDDAGPRTGANGEASESARARAGGGDGRARERRRSTANGRVCVTRQPRRTVCLRTAGRRVGGSTYCDGGVAHRAATDCSLQQWLSGRRYAAAVDARPRRRLRAAGVSIGGRRAHKHTRTRTPPARRHPRRSCRNACTGVCGLACLSPTAVAAVAATLVPPADTYIPPSQHIPTSRYVSIIFLRLFLLCEIGARKCRPIYRSFFVEHACFLFFKRRHA